MAYAAIPVGAARNAGFCFLFAAASFWSLAQVVRRATVFPVLLAHQDEGGAERVLADQPQALGYTGLQQYYFIDLPLLCIEALRK